MFSTAKLWLLQSKLRDPDGQVRERTVRAIGDIGSPAAVKLLVECLEAREDSHVMPTAVGVLAEIGTAEALDGLVATLSGENRAGLQYVVSALSGSGDPRVIPGLLQALTHDVAWDATSAARAVDFLKKHADASVRAGLREALRHNSLQVRWYVVEALGALRDADAIDALVASLDDDSLCVAAARALQNIHSKRALPGLLKALKTRPLEQRGPLLEVLSSLGWKPASAEEHVLHSLAEGRYAEVVAHGPASLGYLLPELRLGSPVDVIQALTQLGDARAVPELIAFGHENRQYAAAVCRALGTLRDKRAVPLLVDVLKHHEDDPEGEHRSAAAWAAGEIGDPRAAATLIAEMRGHQDKVLAAAAEALGKLGEKSAVPLLIEALGHKPCQDPRLCWHVRQAAAEALGKIGDLHAVKPLLLALKHEGWHDDHKAAGSLVAASEHAFRSGAHAREVDKAIAGALERLHHPQTVDALKSMLHGEHHTPWGVVDALERLADPKAHEVLKSVLEGPYGHLKCRAAQALARRQDRSGTDFLIKALAPVADEWSESRKTVSAEVEFAAQYLGELAEPSAVAPLLAALKDLHGPAQQTLQTALRQIVEHAPQRIETEWLHAMEREMHGQDEGLATLAHAELRRRAAGQAGQAGQDSHAAGDRRHEPHGAQAGADIGVTCSCGRRYHVRPELAGKRMKCGHCGQAVIVPAA